MFGEDQWNNGDQWNAQPQTEPAPEPQPAPQPEEPRTEPKPRPKAHKAKAKGHANAAQVRGILEARARVDSVRGVLEELTGRSDDADLTCALLDGRIAPPARLLLDAADEESESARAIGLLAAGQKDKAALRDAARLASALNPDLRERLSTTNAMDLAQALSETAGLLDHAALEDLA